MNERVESYQMQSDYLSQLNKEQSEAVMTTEGPLLVLAGAGTGKTRVLTTRIAHILNSRLAYPSQILAVTFTNKAAREMKTRVEGLLEDSTDGLWLGTFHAIAAKILRRHAELVGLTRDFTIIDMDDQLRLAKRILADLDIDEKKNPPKLMLYLISRYKDKAWASQKVPTSEIGMYADGKITSLYNEYQKRLRELNAVDFGDLLLLNIQLFNNHLDVYEQYRNKFKYILVDEYQDTNTAQYIWLRLLAQGHQNICCVGDDDQSIYGWRGAEVTNILKFDRDFDGAKIIRLEKNYRSTDVILNAATKLVSNNQDRHGKTLWTDRVSDNKIKLNSFYDDREEARYVADEIESLQQVKRMPLNEVGILVRAGYQTRSFEDSLNFLRIPYRIIGGLKFYERAEIRDVIAYIRLLVNNSDNLAFERIINTPKRGVGTTTLQQIIFYSRERSKSFLHAAKDLIANKEIRGKPQETLAIFFNQLTRFSEMLSLNVPHWQVVDIMLQETGYIDMWKNEATEESKERIDNIKELLGTLQDFNDLTEFLEHVSLVTDNDKEDGEGRVSVMTIHAAKGLEFETVFLPGWEEGLFPSQKSLDENGRTALEEERRLAYVAITRAKRNLYISYACNRRVYGSYQSTFPSRFIDELPSDSYEIIKNYGSYYKKDKGRSLRDELDSIINSADKIFAVKKPEPQEAFDQSKLRRGSRVFHQKFGYGIIIKIADSSAEVAFEKAGLKKVMVDYLKF